MTSKRIQEIEKRLLLLEQEKKNLISELEATRKIEVDQKLHSPKPPIGTPVATSVPLTTTDKVELFLKLFRCRESVFPKLWENKNKGIKGYAPACNNEWVRGICEKPKIKCSNCPSQAFPKLDAAAVDAHLRGAMTIGTYAIREDDTCIFLACDFDGEGWAEDVAVYRKVASSLA